MLLLPLAAVIALSAPEAHAQVRHPGVPAGLWSEIPGAVPRVTLPPVDVARYMAEDDARGHKPLRYGAMVWAGTDLLREGRWDVTEDGSLAVRVEIESKGAFSLGLEFTEFRLPLGAQLFLYDDSRQEMLGAYTHANEREDGGFVIEPFPGDRVTVELLLPANATGDARVVIGDVIHDYRGVENLLPEPKFPVGGCLIDVNCPQGNGWDIQKRATVRTLSGGGLCSAALINNTAVDGTRYILTANHCGQSSNTVFTFNYQRSGCGAGGAPTNQTVSGATLLTTNGTVDNRLMRINSTIPASYNAAFAGWTRTTTNATFAFALGHPSGGPKKISIDSNGTIRESNMWRVTWSEGTLEGGSSGGPLFDQSGRIRGPACCVNQFTCNQTAWFGRFDRFWTLNGIAQWLDPLGTGATALDAYDPGGGPVGTPPAITSFSPSSVDAVVPDGLVSVVATGTALAEVTGVEIDGVPLDAFQFSVLGATQVEFLMPRVDKLGPVEVKFIAPGGNATKTIDVVANATPTVDLLSSDPQMLLSWIPADLTLASQPGDLVFVLVSTSNIPSVLPGIIDAGIGNNFFELINLGAVVIDPVKGWNQIQIPLNGLTTGTKLHFQLAKFAGVFPLETGNVQSGTILF